MSYFNEEQDDHMRYLASLPAEAKCACGWYVRGECYGSCYGDEAKGGAEKHATTCEFGRRLTGPTPACTCGALARNISRPPGDKP